MTWLPFEPGARTARLMAACTLKTGPSCALTVFIRNMSLQMQMSPLHVPENTISSDQPYTAHIMVSVFPMFPLRPIRPPPERGTRGQRRHSEERVVRSAKTEAAVSPALCQNFMCFTPAVTSLSGRC
ncbi:hypothetical protein EYF80_032909 [Liparis tanakae]|uniref:Uncharacterized protein n=1 Tax=Liparis tanakae TaxID=230148 RepID=A0A4Z2GU18_9TELE|nr:hypothetical protein EYF80_032909 [Liparis tanakae]